MVSTVDETQTQSRSNNFFRSFIPAFNQASMPATRTTVPPQLYRQSAFDTKDQPDENKPQPGSREKVKKDKKWSIGKLFRRKKKSDESDLSSGSDEGFDVRNKTKRKRHKKKRPVTKLNNFDHIVMSENRRAQSLVKSSQRGYLDDDILSDPSADIITFRNRGVPQVPITEYTKDELSQKSANTSLEGSLRKIRKGRMKARAAIRNSLIKDSSSDEDSKNSSTSSLKKVKSDDSLVNGSWSKRSRGARTDRYIKRLSRDDEHQLNKEAELINQGYSKAEVELLTRTPTSQSSGYGTCKRERIIANAAKFDSLYANDVSKLPRKSESISSFPSTQSYPSSINFNAKVNNETVNYSIPYRTPCSNFKPKPEYENNYVNADVLRVKFPLGNVAHIRKSIIEPPAPPPRDLNRVLNTPVCFNHRDANQVSQKPVGVVNDDFNRIMRRSHDRNVILRRPISNSVDHIQSYNSVRGVNDQIKKDQPKRPASVSAEPNHLYANTPWRAKPEILNSIYRPEPTPFKQDYLYYADETPRSRRPISVQPDLINGRVNEQHVLHHKSSGKPNSASEFWRKMDQDQQTRQNLIHNCTGSESEFLNNARMLNNNRIRPELIRAKTENPLNNLRVSEQRRGYDEADGIIGKPSHIRHKSDTQVSTAYNGFVKGKSPERRKSSNLDDALRELEVIYNSLGLGDEDLLDRAERRELMSPIVNKKFDDLNEDIVQCRQPKKRTVLPRRSTLPDKLQDDMAYRRLNVKEKPIAKTNSANQISYMLASPVYIPYTSDEERYSDFEGNEPDIVQDDVVYRNIKQTKNRLKVLDPQPPFGIPLGPISPAPSSDYLHATPEPTRRSRFTPRRSPDIVSDDLAYRTLRKDKIDDLPHLRVNNSILNDALYSRESTNNMKKKRAVRSLSANIFTMVQKEIDDALNMSKIATVQKTKSNGHVLGLMNETPSDSKNRIKHRNNTVNLFVSDSHPDTLDFVRESWNGREYFLGKPPSGDKSKSSSPNCRSPQPNLKSDKQEFKQVLTLLAKEAMDTSNRLGVALAELDKNRNSRNLQAANKANQESSSQPEIKLVSIHSEVVDGSKNNLSHSKSKDSEEPALKVKVTNEKNLHKPDNDAVTVATVFEPNMNKTGLLTQPETKTELLKPNSQDKLNELNDLNNFGDLKSGITQVIDRIGNVNERLFEDKTDAKDATNKTDSDNKEKNESSEYNSSEELAVIFTASDIKNDNIKDKHCDLNSPKLVKNASQQLRKMSIDQQEATQGSSSSSVPEIPWRKKRTGSEPIEQKDEESMECTSSKSVWYNQPSTIMLACTYTLLCTHNLADMDWLTMLGLILAMVSIIAMLII